MPAVKAPAEIPMFDELLRALGGVSPDRICLDPAPGTATPRDMIRFLEQYKRKFELVDGTLVEKVMGMAESFIAGVLIELLRDWNRRAGNVGMVLGADGAFRLLKKLIRVPDVSFTSWDQFPTRKVPRVAVPAVAPDLAVEVLSRGNTRTEMERKLKEYFLSGVRVVWFVDASTRRARVFTSPDDVTEIDPTGVIDGGDVLPGFQLRVADLFAEVEDEPAPAAPKKPKKKK